MLGLEQLRLRELGGRLERGVEHVRGKDAVDSKQAHLAAPVVEPDHVPPSLLGMDPVGIDLALGVLVASVRVVADGQPSMLVRRLLHRREHAGGGAAEIDVEGVLGVDPERGRQFVEAPGQRSRLVGAGHGEQAGARGDERERLLGRQAQGTVEARRQMDPDAALLHHHVEQVAGRVRRNAHHRNEGDVAQQLVGIELEAGAHLLDGRAVVGCDPRKQRQQPPQPV